MRPPSVLDDLSGPSFGQLIAGPLLFVVGLLVWVGCSLYPGMVESAAGRPFRIREAWDTTQYFIFGLPLMVLAQALAGYFDPRSPARLPLWLLGGHVVGMVLVHPPGTGLGLLPLAILLIGLPLYAGFWVVGLVAAAIARKG